MAKVLLILLLPMFAQAEYRAFLLSISKDGSSREVLSNFDPDQYGGVYPLVEGESIQLLDTWMCWGSQGEGTPICPNPQKSEPTSSSSP